MVARDPEEVLSRPAPPPDAVLRYGPEPEQVADVRFPVSWRSGAGWTAPVAGLVLLWHGGFWRAAYDRAHVGPLATALAAENFAVCAPEYRRVGQPGGGWPGTLEDVAAALNVLPGRVRAAAGRARRDVPRRGEPGQAEEDWPVLLAGHSAGGHLALWAAARAPVAGAVALAPVSDLATCYRQQLGGGAAGAFLGGGPDEWPERYAQADPSRLIPLGAPVRIVHGRDDDRVPAQMSRDFARRAGAAGDDVVLTELTGCGHFEVIDPLSTAWPDVLSAFRAVAGTQGSPE